MKINGYKIEPNADLSGADLTGSNLYRANLSGAYLTGADLRRADLRGAVLRRADLTGTIGIINGGSPDGWTTYGWLRDGLLSVRVGCHEMRLDEGRTYWAGKVGRREVLAMLDYIEAVARMRGWKTEE